MNVVFISPHFPPQFFRFCAALRARGVNVLGLGDSPGEVLSHEQREPLGEYFFARLEDYDQARRALGYLVWRHGRIDRLDSHNEHWLGLEARLREDFNIPGPRPAQMDLWRSKTGMAELFREANVPYPESARVTGPEQVRAFAARHGYPLVIKPDLGVGAARTFRVEDAPGLEAALEEPLEGYLIQPFVHGTIVSYDGLVDAQGRILFETSHVYSAGIMEVVTQQLDVYYWNRRELPADLVELGRRTVETFGVKERFFHVEFFELPGGGYRALEINVRPPGGFTMDMMNYSADIDLYQLWARMLTGDALAGSSYERKYHVAHVARRHSKAYRHSHQQLRELLGDKLLVHQPVPRAFSVAMGDEMYLVRHPEEEALLEAVHLIRAVS